MISVDNLISDFVILWAVIDPVGTIPVFIAATKDCEESDKKRIARIASITAFIILIFFHVLGDFILKKMGVPLAAFQISGGVILFLFAANMIFGHSKPEEEIQLVKNTNEIAIFPLAIPSIAGPGAILAVVLLADPIRFSFASRVQSTSILTIILLINFLLMIFASKIHRRIGNAGAIVISKVMGLIIAAMAANNVLLGIKEFFKIN